MADFNFTDLESFKKILPLDFGGIYLARDWNSPFSLTRYTKGSNSLFVYNSEKSLQDKKDLLVAEEKKKKAAAAARAWSSAQSESSSKAELSEIKAAQSASKALEEIKKKRAAAGAKAWGQSQAINAPTAQASEIYAQMDREEPNNAAAIAEATPEEVKNEIRDEAREAQGKAMQDEQNKVLPEVQVKSDFGKYLLIGGGVLLAYYLLTKKGRK